MFLKRAFDVSIIVLPLLGVAAFSMAAYSFIHG